MLEEANRQIEQASRNKSDFLAIISHDLRTPMDAIIGYTRLLLRKTAGVLDECQFRNLESVEVSAGQSAFLVQLSVRGSYARRSTAGSPSSWPPVK